MELRNLVSTIKAIGTDTGARALWFCIKRLYHDFGYRSKLKFSVYHTPGKLIRFQDDKTGMQIQYSRAKLYISFLTSDMVRVIWEPGHKPLSYSIANNEWSPVILNREVTDTSIKLKTNSLELEVSKHGDIQFKNASREILRTDLPPRTNKNGWLADSKMRSDEHISGMGERALPLNLIGHTVTCWNKDPGGSYGSGDDPLYICTPVYFAYCHSGSYLIFYENSFPALFTFNQISHVEFAGGQLRYYFIYGDPDTILNRYTQLTGHPSMPPRWVFGYHQSRWGYHTEDQVRHVAQGFVDNRLPISAIHLDIDYMDGYRLFTIDQTRFPDLQRLSSDFKNQGINLVSIIDPAVKKDKTYTIYQSGLEKDVFCKVKTNQVLHGVVWPGWAAFPDFSKPETRTWWGEQYRFLLDMGIEGFWHDMNEPVSFSACNDNTLPLTTLHDCEGRGGNHEEIHNLYGFLMNKAAYEALLRLRPEKRPWIISRSGWAGLQRYAWNWTGDVASTWEALRQTIITIIGLGLCGHVFSGADIGGFSGNPSPDLYLRWFQASTFFPFCRTHSAIGTKPREPWSFGEPYLEIIRNYLELRYKLIPYFYTLAWKAHQTGSPLIRPMFWHYPQWSAGWDIEDQFFLGKDILVAPIVNEEAARVVKLPPGGWYDFWNDTYYSGEQDLKLITGLMNIPVFVRSGSIILMENSRRFEIHVYPENNSVGQTELYIDAGDGFGPWRIDTMEFKTIKNQSVITWKTQGKFPFPYHECLLVVHGNQISKAIVDDVEKKIDQANSIMLGQFSKAVLYS
jgi:alpha-glucosidase